MTATMRPGFRGPQPDDPARHPRPDVRPDEVLVRVRRRPSAVRTSAFSRAQDPRDPPRHPSGMSGAGTVAAVRPGVPGYAQGQPGGRVCVVRAAVRVLPRRPRETFCDTRYTLGMRTDGSLPSTCSSRPWRSLAVTCFTCHRRSPWSWPPARADGLLPQRSARDGPGKRPEHQRWPRRSLSSSGPGRSPDPPDAGTSQGRRADYGGRTGRSSARVGSQFSADESSRPINSTPVPLSTPAILL